MKVSLNVSLLVIHYFNMYNIQRETFLRMFLTGFKLLRISVPKFSETFRRPAAQIIYIYIFFFWCFFFGEGPIKTIK